MRVGLVVRVSTRLLLRRDLVCILRSSVMDEVVVLVDCSVVDELVFELVCV